MVKLLTFLALIAGSAVASGIEFRSLDTRQSSVKTVNTSSGLISGHLASNATANVAEYLGIPFAQPPVGELRFAPPQPYNGTSSINGTNYGFSCPARVGGERNPNIAFANLTAAGIDILTKPIGINFSEDCLTLNVWVPSGGEASKAVLLWIYGGGFSTGTSDNPTFNGQNIAAQEDVIVVSINYRLNIFGFPGNPSTNDLNLGLLDQRLAVEWVRDNIPEFGGDASRITLFGQSAGSASVDYYSYAYASDPIVNGLIEESGTISGFGTVSQPEANAAWFNVTTTLSCGSSTSNANDVLACMRTKTFQSIIAAIPSAAPGSITGGLSNFGPTVDDITVFSDYPARSLAGNFTKVPLLIGNADYEAGLFAASAALANATYPSVFWTEFDLTVFTCPAAYRSNISINAGVPTWRYRWFGDFPNLRLTSVPDSGAYHGSELAVLFGNFPTGTGIPATTPAEASIGDYIRGAWASFAKDPVNGLSTYGWPKYNPSGNTLVRLAYNNVTGANLAMPVLYDGACATKLAVNVTANSTASATATASGMNGGASSSALPTGTSSASPSSSAPSGGSRVHSSGSVLVGLIALALACLC